MSEVIEKVGKDGELIFKDLLNKKGKLFFEIVQKADKSYSKKLKEQGGKRPDFIVCNENGQDILIDVKHIKIQEYEYNKEPFEYFTINDSELYKALKTEEILKKDFYFFIKNNKKEQEHFNWYAIKASSIKNKLEDFQDDKVYKSTKDSNLINIKTTATQVMPNKCIT